MDNKRMNELRQHAERELVIQPEAGAGVSTENMAALVQELQIQQIELRRHNDELVRTNTALERTRQEYLELFEHAPVGYVILDESGAVVRANLTLCRLLGLDRARLLRRRFSAFLEPADVSSFSLFLRRIMTQDGTGRLDLWLVGAEGERVAAQLEGLAVSNPNGPGRLGRLTVTDITVQRQAQEEVLRLNATLEERVEQRTQQIVELNGELETFVYAVSHDLKTPLRHIRSFTALLACEFQPLAEQPERYLQHVEHSVTRIEEQVTTLLTFFRAGQGRLRFQDVPLGQVLKEVRKEFAAEVEGREVQITVGDLPVIQGDSLALQLVFSNLLGNALKFTRGRTPARIHVNARETEREFIVGVQDNGVGFNMRQKDRLFGVFQRLHREGDFEGNGVGLALVRRVVHRHGGRVWAEGKPGEGATFWLSLPKHGAPRI